MNGELIAQIRTRFLLHNMLCPTDLTFIVSLRFHNEISPYHEYHKDVMWRELMIMAHKISPGPKPNIVIMRLIGNLNYDDLRCDEELGLNTGRPLHILLDCAQMRVELPEDLLNEAKHSFLVNPNLVHVALNLESQTARMVALMVAKATCGKEKLSLHNNYGAALNYLLEFARKHAHEANYLSQPPLSRFDGSLPPT